MLTIYINNILNFKSIRVIKANSFLVINLQYFVVLLAQMSSGSNWLNILSASDSSSDSQ